MRTALFVFSLVPTWLLGQAYVPFISTPDSSDTWTDIHSCTDFDCWYSYTNQYTVEGDTMIGDLEYAKIHVQTLYEEGADYSQWCNESIYYYDSYIAIREEDKRVYVNPLNTLESEEYLAYDFNLSVGDTVPDPAGIGLAFPYLRVIESIDSVQMFGVYRKRYLLDSFRYIVEGVGASTGLLNQVDVMYSSECYFSLLCYQEAGESDFFMTNCETALDIAAIPETTHPRKLVKIVDCMGRETTEKPNTILLYIYSNGEVEKVFRSE